MLSGVQSVGHIRGMLPDRQPLRGKETIVIRGLVSDNGVIRAASRL